MKTPIEFWRIVGLTLFSLLMWNIAAPAQIGNAPQFLWAKQAGGTDGDNAAGSAIDAEGNVYVLGSFRTNATFGSLVLSNNSQPDVFLAKLNASGVIVWANRGGGAGIDYGRSVAVDNFGNVYITGYYFSNDADFGNGVLTNAGGCDLFVAKFSGAGSLLWAHRAGGDNVDVGYGLATDGAGNVYVTGNSLSSVIDFDGTTLTNNEPGTSLDSFIAKYNSAGALLWVKQASGDAPGDITITESVAVDSGGAVYITGQTSSTNVFFGGSAISTNAPGGNLVLKATSAGDFVWVNRAISGGGHGQRLAVDGSGGVLVVGEFNSANTDLGAGNLSYRGGVDIFVAKYDAVDGATLWTTSLGGSGNDAPRSVSLNAVGEAYVSGFFDSSNALFGSFPLASTTGAANDAFLAKLSSAGTVQWARKVGGIAGDEGAGLAVHTNGDVILAGTFASPSMTLDGITLTNSGSSDIFLGKLNYIPPIIAAQPQSQIGVPGSSLILSVSVMSPTPLSYQWSKDGVSLTDGNGFSGSTTSNLLIANLQESQAGRYSVTVTNLGGSVTSVTATVTVTDTAGNVAAAYIANYSNNTVSVIAQQTLVTLATIPVGNHPYRVVATPDGRRVYVSNRDSGNISVIDTATRSVVATIPVENEPESMVVSADGLRLYVVNTGSASFSVIETTSNLVITNVPTASTPSSIALHPVRGEVWVGFNTLVTALEVRSITNFSLLASLATGANSHASSGLAFTPDGSVAFTAESCGCCGRFYRLLGTHAGGIITVDLANILADGTGAAYTVAVHPATGQVYLGKSGHCGGVPRVYEFGTGRSLPLPAFPRDVAVNPTKNQLWVTLGNDTVVVADTVSLTNVGVAVAGARTEGVALAPFNVSGLTAASVVVRVNGEYKTNNVHLIDSPVAVPATVELVAFPAQASIRYTLDGSTPQINSSLYAGSFSVVPPARIRAAAFDGGNVGYSPEVSVFMLPYYSMTNLTPGGGKVLLTNSELVAINGPYRTNSQITLTAVPSTGWTFLQWEGDIAGINPTNTLTMNGPRTVRAVFGHPLSVATFGGNGASGVISNNPTAPLYAYGQTVLLSGLPEPDSLLAGWGNGGITEFTVNPLPLVIDENHTTISAYFLRKAATNLTLNVTVSGGGIVLRNPDSPSYPSNSFVSLQAIANAGFVFDQWQGDVAGNQNPLTLQVHSNLTVVASFVPRVPPFVELLAPTNGSVVTGPTNMLVTITAASSNSVIQRLELYEDANLLSVITTNTNSLICGVVLTNLSPRTNAYALYVRAVDIRGLAGFSATNALVVMAPPDYVTFGFLPATPILEYYPFAQVRVLKFGSGTGSVAYATEALTAQPVTGLVGDFVATNGTLNFASNQAFRDIYVTLNDDNLYEGDETFALQLTPLSNSGLAGSGRQVITIIDSTYLSAVSFLERVAPSTLSPATNSLRVWLEPLPANGEWRFVWETTWRTNGAAATNLQAGNYELEFRPLPDFAPLTPATVTVMEDGETGYTNRYLATGQSMKGALNVQIVPFEGWSDAGWRIAGSATWNSPATPLLDGLKEGAYTLEFKGVTNWIEPDARLVRIWTGQQTDVIAGYKPAEPAPDMNLTLSALPNFAMIQESATNQSGLPYAWVGQVRAGGGWGTGFAPRERVVVTAGHVVFDTVRLAAAGEIFWFPQRHAGEHEPKPMRPRGWMLMGGYAAGLQSDQNAGNQPTPGTQNQDAAVLYFSSPVVRGGYSGYVADEQGGWLTITTNHQLVGFPTRNVPENHQGRMHATPAADYHFTAMAGAPQVFLSTNFLGLPGVSGGPLCVWHTNGNWYPAGIYLGVTGAGQARVRAIDGGLVSLIQKAVDAANASEDQTDLGPGIPIIGLTNGFNLVQLSINVQPISLLTALQALQTNLWCRVGDGTNFAILHFTNSLSVTTPLFIQRANYILFGAVPGWQTPATITMNVTSGQDITINARYESNAPPVITVAPSDVAGLVGNVTQLAGAAVGAGPLSYQWLRDGDLFAGAASASLTFPILSPANAGWYSLRVTNSYGAVTSPPVRLTVGPELRWQTTNLMVLGTAGRTIVLEKATQWLSTGFNWEPWRTNSMTNNEQLIDTLGWLSHTQQAGFLRVKVIP